MGKADGQTGGEDLLACRQESQENDIFAAPSAGVRWLLGCLALAATIVCGYLLYISLVNGGSPAGCGAGSPCESVLGSRWSNVAGVPVAAPAAVLWLLAIVAVRYACPRKIAAVRQAAWASLLVIAAAALGAAIWFLALQHFVLDAWCPWCLALHTIGLAFAGVVVVAAPKRGGGFHPTMLAGLFALGLCLAGSLASAQLLLGPRQQAAHRASGGRNEDRGAGLDRRISVLGGQLLLAPHAEPILGSPDAPKLLVLLFDYRCTHCRQTHRYLREAMARHPGQVGVIVMPTPLSAECNPLFQTTEPEFEEACAIAELALSLWQAAPEKFAEFDAWLIDSEKPPRLNEARRRAEELATRESLDAAFAGQLDKPSPREMIARNVKAYADTGAFNPEYTLPMILSPHIDSIIGKPTSAEELFQLLESELQLDPSQELRKET